jgi:eukaryotic-like serine/threonine-protein kinase
LNHQWQEVERLFHLALEKEAGERAAFLADACAGDDTLRSEVESLLRYEGRAAGFIETPALEATARMLAEAGDPLMAPGRSIRQYTIVAPLGAGGMGEVYLAEDTRLARRVALKFLPARLTGSPEHLRRFEQEARAVAALSHPNVCTIHEVLETDDGRYCLVMEHVEGETLRQRLLAGSLEVEAVLDVAIQIATALAAAHAAGLVHRDVKPENVMLRRDGYVKVLDFGLAKLSERHRSGPAAEARLDTAPGVVMGTASYMSPEQARGLPVDARTDLWSLGVVLYEMLAGVRPFDAATPTDVLVAVVEHEPAPLAARAPGVPLALERIVRRLLAKDREGRHPTAEDLLAELRRVRQEVALVAALPPTARHGGAVRRLSHGPLPWRRLGTAAIVAAAMGLIVLAATRWSQPPRLAAAGSAAVEPAAGYSAPVRLAVLPLHDSAGDPDGVIFADGMTELLIAELAQLSSLRVTSRTSSLRFRASTAPLPVIARELGVAYLVEGSVFVDGGNVRINAELVEAATDSHLWARTYERRLEQVMAVQAELAADIAREVAHQLSAEDRRRLARPQPEVNAAAQRLYLHARHLWNQRTEASLREAMELYRSALAIDPGFAPAYAGLAECWVLLGAQGIGAETPAVAIAEAKRHAREALALDGSLADAHAVYGYAALLGDWDWATAGRELRRALELNPSQANTRFWYAAYLASAGRFDTAREEIRLARQVDPLAPIVGAGVSWIEHLAGNEGASATAAREVLARDPAFPLAHWRLGVALHGLGRRDEAIAALRRAVETSAGSPDMVAQLGFALAAAGDLGGARREEQRLAELAAERYVSAYGRALLALGTGDREAALDWLERAAEERSWYLPWIAVEPELAPLRDEPRFVTLVRRLGVPLEGGRAAPAA